MKVGDRVVVYHTGDEKAAVGLAERRARGLSGPEEEDPRLSVVDLRAGEAAAAAGDPGRDQGAARLRREPARAAGAAVGGAPDGRAVEGARGDEPRVSERRRGALHRGHRPRTRSASPAPSSSAGSPPA